MNFLVELNLFKILILKFLISKNKIIQSLFNKEGFNED
jgi:hypothetical protein